MPEYDAKWDVARWDLSRWDEVYATFGTPDAYLTWLRTYRRRKKKPLTALTTFLKLKVEERSQSIT